MGTLLNTTKCLASISPRAYLFSFSKALTYSLVKNIRSWVTFVYSSPSIFEKFEMMMSLRIRKIPSKEELRFTQRCVRTTLCVWHNKILLARKKITNSKYRPPSPKFNWKTCCNLYKYYSNNININSLIIYLIYAN